MCDEIILSELAQRFLSIIEEKNITPYELGKKEGLSSQIFYNIKAGKSNPSLKTINALLKIFPDINPEWLQYGKGSMFLDTQFIIHENKSNILESYTLEEIVSFVIENEKEILKSSPLFKEYIKLKENQAVLNYLESSIRKLSK